MYYSEQNRIDLNSLSEAEKEKEEYLMEMIDFAIAELVYDKDHLKKAYNYYNGIRDEDQFRHLEENFGIGTPTSIEFTPLIRRHIDVLVGEHLQTKIKPYVTCKDKETLSKINKEKLDYINKEELAVLQRQLQTNLKFSMSDPEEQQQKPVDNASEEALAKLKRDAERDFISEFEISAHYVLKNLIQSKQVDIHNKMRLLFLDLLIAGQCYYKVEIIKEGMTPVIEVLNPFDVFCERNFNSPYTKKSTRLVNRRWMNRQQIITKYGKHLSKDDIDSLRWELGRMNTGTAHYTRATGSGIIGSGVGVHVTPNSFDESEYSYQDLYPVYEVEWLANTRITGEDGKTDYRTDRYYGTRIGEAIYVNMGKDDQQDPINDPYGASLSVNGISYDERSNKPYSLVLKIVGLQDKYDILHFYRDNLIASSGVRGDWLDVSNLPTFLGTDVSERIQKFVAYKKQGIALVDTSQENGGANHNTMFGGFDDTVQGNAIQAIQLAIQQTEEICSSVTGIFRERLGGIEQRDAVTNVEVGIKQSGIITKQYYKMMDSVTNELLIDALNACRVSYKKGVTGSIILGNRLQKIFTIDPKKFCMTDYDVHIADSSDTIKDMDTIKSVSMELIKGGQVDIDILLEAMTSESLTEMKENVSRSYKEKKAENDQLNQAMQQLEQMKQQLTQAQQEAQKLAQENEMLKNQGNELKKYEIDQRMLIEKDRNRITETANTDKNEIEEKKVELEKLQLLDNNPFNNDVKF